MHAVAVVHFHARGAGQTLRCGAMTLDGERDCRGPEPAHGSDDDPVEQVAKRAQEERLQFIGAFAIIVVVGVAALIAAMTLFHLGVDVAERVLKEHVSVDPKKDEWPYYVIGLIWLAITSTCSRWLTKKGYVPPKRKDAEQLAVEKAEAEVRGALKSTDFAALWNYARTLLDYYHKTALRQSKGSFWAALVASLVGLAVVVACATLAVRVGTTSAAVATALLGAAGAGMSGYVGATFLGIQRITAEQSRNYFNHPLNLSRYLAAERLLHHIEDSERKEAAAAALLQAIVATGEPDREPEAR